MISTFIALLNVRAGPYPTNCRPSTSSLYPIPSPLSPSSPAAVSSFILPRIGIGPRLPPVPPRVIRRLSSSSSLLRLCILYHHHSSSSYSNRSAYNPHTPSHLIETPLSSSGGPCTITKQARTFHLLFSPRPVVILHSPLIRPGPLSVTYDSLVRSSPKVPSKLFCVHNSLSLRVFESNLRLSFSFFLAPSVYLFLFLKGKLYGTVCLV